MLWKKDNLNSTSLASRRYILTIFSFLFTLSAFSQETKEEDPETEKVMGLVSYYKFMLNTIGSAKTPTREKEVIIKNSYEKAFRDDQVQIEDDLLTDRTAIINKNVQAYLRDVDFFFKEVQFDFTDIAIESNTDETGDTYYLASFVSTREGISLEGESFKTSQDRFMEVNREEDGLKIASIYSTKVSKEEELRTWWETLSTGWLKILKDEINASDDSLTTSQLLEISTVDSLDLSGEIWIQDIEPLAMIRGLRYLNLSNTSVRELSPIRYASNLRGLELAKTPLSDLEILNYFGELTFLNISQTRVMDLTPLEKLESIEKLAISNLDVLDYSSISALTSLKSLDISFSSFADDSALSGLTSLQNLNIENSYLVRLDGLEPLKNLEVVNISYTYVNEMGILASLPKLKILYVNHTDVYDISPLNGHPSLEKIYADYTRIRESEAIRFMKQNPDILVVNNTEEVMKWWNGLSPEWQRALQSNAELNVKGDTENLIKLLQIDSMNLSGLRLIKGNPLSEFTSLTYLNTDGNLFTNLEFVSEMKELEIFTGKDLPVDDLSPLTNCPNLTDINLEGTLISDLTPLFTLDRIQELNIERTEVNIEQIVRFLTYNTRSTVLFKSEELMDWWESLTPIWQETYSRYLSRPDPRSLHRLIERDSLVIEGIPVKDLSPMKQFIRLKYLYISNTQVSDLSPLINLKSLTSLYCKNGPLSSLESIYSMFQLQELSISNTPVDDLNAVSSLRNLEKLDCSGTQIKNIRDLRELKSLRYLDISNTRVWQLHWLHDMPDFDVLICYNSRVKERKLADFKSRFPECKVTFY